MGAWLPIETAPRDGTNIILGRAPCEDEESGYVAEGCWHEEDHDGPDNMGHDAGFMDNEFRYFRCARSFGAPSYRSAGVQPTHWMPLPPAPGATPAVPTPDVCVPAGDTQSAESASEGEAFEAFCAREYRQRWLLVMRGMDAMVAARDAWQAARATPSAPAPEPALRYCMACGEGVTSFCRAPVPFDCRMFKARPRPTPGEKEG